MTRDLISATIALTSDGALHIRATHKGWAVERRFPPAMLLALKEWLQKPETWASAERDEFWHDSQHSRTILYSHDTGLLTIDPDAHEKGYYKPRSFDPSSDESLASMVRHLKRVTPMPPRAEERTLPGILPTPTEEQMRNRTIFTAVGTPDGVGRYSKPKQRFQQPAVGAAKSKELIDGILDGLLSSGLK